MKRRLCAVVTWGALLAAPLLYAEEGYGSLAGQILDAQSGSPVSGANVALLEDPVFFVRTDLNGGYVFQDVPAGTYTIRVFKGGYEPYDVTGVEVGSEEAARVDVPLPRRKEVPEEVVSEEQPSSVAAGDDIFEMAAFEVTAEVIRSTEATLLASRQRSASLSDAIGGETFSRLSLGDAAEAMTKVTGASVVDGKYIFIRGLGDRYSNTLLNGASIPSADPDKRSVQMDQFPSDLLESIVTSKSFTPDQPGSFSGGSVNVRTKSFPDQFFITLGVSAEYNSQTTGEDIYVTEQGVNWDGMGVDNRPRTTVDPDDIPPLSGRGANTATGAALQGDLRVAERLDAITREFPRNFYPTRESALPSYGGSLSFGDSIDFKNDGKLGYTVSFTWDRDYSHYEDGIEARWQTPDEFENTAQVYTTDPEILERLYWYSNYLGAYADPYDGDIPFGVTKSTQSVSWGAFGKVAYLPGEHHELSLTLFHNQSAEDEVKHGVGDGFYSSLVSQYLFEAVSVLYTERGISSGQLNGQHLFVGLHDLEVEWQASLAESTQDQPDYRTLFTAWDFPNEQYRRVNTSDLDPPIRRYRELVEDNMEYKVDFTLPFGLETKLKWGALASDSSRDYNEITYSVTPLTWQGQPDPDLVQAIYTDPYIGFDRDLVEEIDTDGDGIIDRYNLGPALQGRHFIARGRGGNIYQGDGSVEAAYLMTDFTLLEDWRIITGARFERNQMDVLQYLEQQGAANIEGGFKSEDLLPALSIVYQITEKQNLRFAYGRTIATPTFKELSPVVIVDSFTGDQFQGNPNLNRTLIDNVDLRWEWFIEGMEMVAVSAFYKKMEDPIEVLFFGGEDVNGDGILDNRDIQPFTRGNIVPQNVDEATIYGLEFEWRYSLGRLSESLSRFSLGGNISLIESEVSVPLDEQRFFGSEAMRQLVGQSPFLVNFDFSYENDEVGTYLNLSYNYTDERLSVVNPNNTGLGDVWETGVSRLDLIWTQRLNGNMKLKVAVQNLLDPTFEKYYAVAGGPDRIYESYQTGISASIGLTYTFE